MTLGVSGIVLLSAFAFYLIPFSQEATRLTPNVSTTNDPQQATDLERFTEAIECTVSSDEQEEVVDAKVELHQVSDLTIGHDANYEDVLSSFEDVFDWGVPLKVDEAGLKKYGVHLNEILFYGSLHADGVSRRSSLRFVLDVAGIGYFVDDNKRLVVTRKQLAKVQWLSQLKNPQVEGMNSMSVDIRRETVFSSGFGNVDSELWERALVIALDDEDRDVRFDAAFALGELGPEATGSIDTLCKLMESEDLTLRAVATYAIAKTGPKAIPKLLDLMNHKDRAIATAAVRSLGAMGGAGNDAVPGLLAAGVRFSENTAYLDREDFSRFCLEIATALAMVELGDAMPSLCDLLRSKNAVTRSFAISAIRETGGGGGCEPELLRLLSSDPSVQVRRDAAYFFTQIDLPWNSSTDVLETATKDPDDVVRHNATVALEVQKSKR